MTYVFGAINTSSPTVMLPTMVELMPIHTESPIVGVPLRFPPVFLADSYAFVDIAVLSNLGFAINRYAIRVANV